MPLPILEMMHQFVVEPMQVDIEPAEHDMQEHPVEQNFVIENPTLDLEVYASNYSSLMKTERLLFVAKHAPSLKAEALRMALSHVQKFCNVKLYKEIHDMLTQAVRESSALPDALAGLANQIPPLDSHWVDQTTKRAQTLLEKLDTDLKNYKDNSIKESIRRGHDDLGNHYMSMGDLTSALKCFSKARDYCTSSKHIVTMCLNIIQVSVYLHHWSHVLTYVNKAESSGEFSEKDKESHLVTLAKLRCAAGLAGLATDKYKVAAKNFIQLLSPSNVAVYGSLCALATFSRKELQSQVINSSSFKLVLELEPQIRDIVFAFYESNYSKCLSLLQSLRDNFRLDVFLSPHVEKLYSKIRNRSLIQYFSPYVVADMRKMAEAFNCTVAELENELMTLILNGEIQARIDSGTKSRKSPKKDEIETDCGQWSLLLALCFRDSAK